MRWLSPVLLLLVACADLKIAPPDADAGTGASSSPSGSGASNSGGAGGALSSGNGPGPHGALPTGYCCTKNEECRTRNCADVGGAKMCLDACRHQETCIGKNLPSGFTCDAPSIYDDGWCRPPPGFACLAASTFVRGGKLSGACCTATGDGTSGLECEGGHCLTYSRKENDNPFVCTNACEVPGDCGPGFTCDYGIGICVPGNDPYVCE